MNHQYKFDPSRQPERALAIQTLVQLSQGEIVTRMVVETENVDLARILRALLPDPIDEMVGQVENNRVAPAMVTTESPEARFPLEKYFGGRTIEPDVTEMDKMAGRLNDLRIDPAMAGMGESHPWIESTRKGPAAASKGKLDPRKCAQCGEEFYPKRIDQILCLKAECRKAWQKVKNEDYRKKHALPAEEVQNENPLSNSHSPD